MQAAETPAGWPPDATAATILVIIHELIAGMRNDRWRAAAEAAFRIPPERYGGVAFDSLASRFRRLAESEEGAHPKVRAEAYRGYWISGASRLASSLEARLNDLARHPEGWEAYRTGIPPSPPSALPLSFDQTDVLYRFAGRRGIQAITYRWVTAHAPVDHYGAVGWYFNEPDAPVEVVPLANCSLEEPLLELPEGGRLAKLRFARQLAVAESYFFACTTLFHSNQPCRPSISYECRGLAMRSLTIRAQFDPAAMPRLLWWFDVGPSGHGHDVPESGDPRILDVAGNGYVQHEFHECKRGRKCGLRWIW